MNEISREIKTRQDMASNLQSQIQDMDQIASLKKPEVEPVRKLFREEIDKEIKMQRRYSFRDTFLISFIFFILGVIVTEIITGGLKF